MAEIATIILSPMLQVIFDRMASKYSCEFLSLFFDKKLSNRLLKKLRIALLTVNAVVEDAEDRQFTDTSVKLWLDELKDTIYDVEDILDEIASENLRLKLEAEVDTIANQVRHSDSASLFDVNKIEGDINVAVETLEDLAKQIGVLGLRASVGGNPSERSPTTSLVEESHIYGRRDDKDTIINLLFSDCASGDENMGVIAIIGMGGIGKTTLAQLVYNDNRLKDHFDLKAWVCVSDDFDVLKLTKTILEEVGSPANTDSENLNMLQRNLEGALTGKKFLVVLDDVWNKMFAKWELLSNAFKSGAQGSKVIVTTRDQEVASVMFASATHHLDKLPKAYCWSLFVNYASHNGNFDARLEELGKKIVEKCKGLPLAIKAIGALLGSKFDVKELDKVLTSKLWDLPIEETGILPALGLSYKYLSPYLKRCFAYCSIFPKGYAFKKDTLVLLWMAEGFLPELQNKTMEEVGDDYFLALVSRSLFQPSSHDEYIMHDLVSDMAKFISKQFTLSHEDDCSHEIGSNTRHFSYSSKTFGCEKLKQLERANRLRSIVELNFSAVNTFVGRGIQVLLPMIRCLRVLILSHYGDITKLTDSIGDLIHLRYLDLSCSRIKSLPDSICMLCNLQILNLSRCRNLSALPEDMHKLISLQMLNLLYCRRLVALPRDVHKLHKLRHLNIAETGILEMPINLGELKCLQTLSTFIVNKQSAFGIEELGKLTNLRGSLSILDLQNIEFPIHPMNLNLGYVKHLEELVLKWKVDTNASESHKDVLDSLKPHSVLKSLDIYGYGGTSFPNWVGDASFSSVVSLRLENCKFCSSLPLLLPSIKKLYIQDCPQVELFPKGDLPSNLNEIFIHNCDKLFASRMGWGLQKLPFVRRFSIGDKSEDVKSFPDKGLLPPGLTYLNIDGFPNLESLDKKGLQHLIALEELEIRMCPKLKCMPDDGLPASLSTLRIYNCPLLKKELERWNNGARLVTGHLTLHYIDI